jgi:endo-1,4-beta-xylanase
VASNMLTRRSMLSKLIGCAACAPGLRLAASPASASLKGSTGSCGWGIGLAVDSTKLNDSKYVQFILNNFSLVTLSGMKWDRLRPKPQAFDFSEADTGMQFAMAHQLRVHGHNLCWNAPGAEPAWFKTDLDRGNAQQTLVNHINTVVTRYKGKLDCWDIVNEPVVHWSKRPDLLYPGTWVNLLGPQYIDIAFHAAAEADPKPLRVMNIYDVEQDSANCANVRRAVLALLHQLLGRGVPVQAIGIESHLDASVPLGGPAYVQFLQEIQSMGLQIMITELDVKESRTTGSSQDWDRQVSENYRKYLDDVLPHVTSHRVIFWSAMDRWEAGRRVQGLLEADYSPRLNFNVAESSLARLCR